VVPRQWVTIRPLPNNIRPDGYANQRIETFHGIRVLVNSWDSPARLAAVSAAGLAAFERSEARRMERQRRCENQTEDSDSG